jgi:hypothetical protein
LQNALIDPGAPRELAVQRMAELDSPSGILLDLAAVGNDAALSELVDRLAASEAASSEEQLREEWLYLVLAWIYENRANDADPLQRVEEVYADFGYPEDVASFVRYMPMVDPDLGSRHANEDRLFEKWQRYLEGAGKRWS